MKTPDPVQTFLNEAGDLLSRIEETTLTLNPGEPAGEVINQLFRAFHTLKGSGAMFGFDTVADFTHHIETVLDQVREGSVPVSEELVDLILRSKDQIKALLEAAQNAVEPAPAGGEIIAALNALLPAKQAAEAASPRKAVISARDHVTSGTPTDEAATKTFHIRFRPDPAIMVSGTNPIVLLNELRELGECRIAASTDAVPELDRLQPDHCHLAWEITLTTVHGVDSVKDVFIFVESGSELAITEVAREFPASRDTASAAAMPDQQPRSPAEEASVQAGRPTESRGVSKASSGRKLSAHDSTVRVPSERLDRLVNLVGEFVMNQSRLTQMVARTGDSTFLGPIEELERLVAELRDNVLGIRMMPIGTTFGRFKRLVRDLSRELGKEVELITEGEETELDKTMLDQLGEPLVHLIRNSLDHGIESLEQRELIGKPQAGALRLNASHEGAHVVITIQDDGRGLDRAAIQAKAVEKGLIGAEAQLSEAEIFNLVLLPGFSTARSVSSVSGRGVGMDVVKRTIESLRGSIDIASVPGRGTTVRLTLPLTLAIIEGLLVEIGKDQFIIPMAAVTENVELERAARQANNGRNVVVVRGQQIPYIRLRELFEIRGAELDLEKIVIVATNDQRLGLVVDRVVGSHQTVIQSLSQFYRGVELFSGTTIMGDGRVAMILDLAGMVRSHGGIGAIHKGSSKSI